MSKPDTPSVAKLLRKFAQRSALRGGTPYRIKPYARAADALAALAEPLDDLIVQGHLKEIPGVGNAIADIITKTPEGLHEAAQDVGEKMRRVADSATDAAFGTAGERAPGDR